jgi:hypothetical protein
MSRFTDLFQEPKAVATPVEPIVEEKVEVKETKVTSILGRIKSKKENN